VKLNFTKEKRKKNETKHQAVASGVVEPMHGAHVSW
jgi:hypothetical protein